MKHHCWLHLGTARSLSKPTVISSIGPPFFLQRKPTDRNRKVCWEGRQCACGPSPFMNPEGRGQSGPGSTLQAHNCCLTRNGRQSSSVRLPTWKQTTLTNEQHKAAKAGAKKQNKTKNLLKKTSCAGSGREAVALPANGRRPRCLSLPCPPTGAQPQVCGQPGQPTLCSLPWVCLCLRRPGEGSKSAVGRLR